MRGKKQLFFTKAFQLINVEEMREIEKSPLENCYKQDPQMNAKISWKV